MSGDNLTCHEIALNACLHWYAYQDSVELENVCQVVRDFKPKVVVEIGIANGASLASWAEAAKPELVIGIDPLNNPKTKRQEESLKNLIKTYNMQIIANISRAKETHEQLKTLLGGRKIDFLFIDAEHKYDDIRHDWYTYLSYMNRPSIVGLHDIYGHDDIFDSGQQVSYLWERLKRQYKKYDEFHHHSTMGVGIIYLE